MTDGPEWKEAGVCGDDLDLALLLRSGRQERARPLAESLAQAGDLTRREESTDEGAKLLVLVAFEGGEGSLAPLVEGPVPDAGPLEVLDTGIAKTGIRMGELDIVRAQEDQIALGRARGPSARPGGAHDGCRIRPEERIGQVDRGRIAAGRVGRSGRRQGSLQGSGD